MIDLTDRTVLITGASSGIGRACAFAFGHAGARLVMFARRLNRLEQIQAQLKQQNVDSIVAEADLRDSSLLDEVWNKLPEDWRAVDILINNAGLAIGTATEWETEATAVDAMIDTNIKSLLHMTRLCVPGMINRGRGHVINLGSVAGHEAYPGGSIYCATKFAVRALSRALKMDLIGTPVRVSSIDPGMVETEFSVIRFAGDQAKADQVYSGMSPLLPEDIADAALYAATRPEHVNISEMLIFPTAQASARMVHRGATN